MIKGVSIVMMQQTQRSQLFHYGVAITVCLLALLLRLLLAPLLQENAPLLVFIIPVMISAWYGGIGPGLLATALSATIGTYFFIEPALGFSVAGLAEPTRITIFLTEGILISGLNESRIRAKERSEAIATSLRKSEAQYRLLIESVRDYAIYLMDLNGRVVSWNAGATQIKGYTTAEILGRHYSIFFTPEEVERRKPEAVLETAATRGYFAEENWRQRKDGSRFWATVVLTPVYDDTGQLQGFTNITRDITDRQQAEAALQQEKAASDLERKRLQTVLDILPVGVFIADHQGKILQANAMIKRIWGGIPATESPAEYAQFKGWWTSNKAPIAPSEWALTRALTAGETSIEEEIEIETFDHNHKVILNSAVPIRDEAGAIVNAVVVNVDITRRKQAEEAMRRSGERLAALHEIDQAILRAESSQEVASAALERLRRVMPYSQAVVIIFDFAAQQAELLAGGIDGETAGSTVPLDQLMLKSMPLAQGSVRYIQDLATLAERPLLLNHQLIEGQRSLLTASIVAQDELIGELHLFASTADCFNQEHQEIAAEIANQLAIALQQARLREQLQHYATELEQRVIDRTAALQSANEELEAFGYSVAHDLRAPLRAIQGLGNALLEDYGDQFDEMGQLLVERIAASADQMDTLITDLLAYSRLSRTEIHLQPVSLGAIVAETLTQLQQDVQSSQAQIQIDEPLPDVVGNRLILMQVITNLIVNALKFVAPQQQPRIHIWAESISGSSSSGQGVPCIRLWVEDNGIGIDPKHQTRIFGVFERLHGIETYPGTGIGLAIVRKGVERMGGRVGVESQPGQGSRFWIELLQITSTL
jgi:PAS domain S-box-containing protein